MSVTVFAQCVRAVARVAICRVIGRAVARIVLKLALACLPLGGSAKRADYIAIASSLSPPVR